MIVRTIAVISVDSPLQVGSFYGWLSRNREWVLAISHNQGCGCWLDTFQLKLGDGAEAMPCESGGDFDSAALRFGHKRDAVISAILHRRFRNA
jgi:hypothetical protein